MYKYKNPKIIYPEREEILSWLRYIKESGSLVWLSPKSKRVRAGRVAGCLNNKGYLQVRINGVDHFIHRIIWFLEKGNWPNIVDHINGIKTDNRIENLRDVDAKGNMQNLARHRKKYENSNQF